MLDKKVAIVTGSSSGIGEATARLFAKAGYRVVLTARRVERLEEIKKEIEAAGGEALVVASDVSDLPSIQHLIETTIQQYGKIDVLFNNAGFGRTKWLEEMDPEKDIAAQMQVNVLGVIQATRAALPQMIKQRGGHIINMASHAGHVATPTYTIYAACKFAVRGFTDALRREVGVWGIKVSAIFPGGVATEFGQHTEAKRKTGIQTPKSLLLSADDVGRMVVRVADGGRSRMVIMPWISRFYVLWFAYIFPGITDWVIERTFTRPERGL